MNNYYKNNTVSLSKLMLITLITIWISACADTTLVTMGSSIKQVNNLDDYDRDGVIKARDKCAETVIGANIDNYGCGKQFTHIKPFNIEIKFANNSHKIPSAAYATIKKLADFLEKHPKLNVLVEGHTSKVGGLALNQKLSKDRAKAVAFVLVNDFNIPKKRVSSIGYGFSRLEEEGDTPEANAANRRIVVNLSYTQYVNDISWTIYTVDQVK